MANQLTMLLRLGTFAVLLFASTTFREGEVMAVQQALVWVPSGVAVAGVWLLGWRSLWIVGPVIAATRIHLGYPPAVVLAAGLGSTAEAAAGVAMLRWLRLRGDFARLRDPLALFAAAAVAPLASIVASWLSRQIPSTWGRLPFYSGWDGWWRMNALGILTVVPLATIWLRGTGDLWPRRRPIEGTFHLVTALALLATVMVCGQPSPTSILVLFIGQPLALLAALRCDQRCSLTIATVGTLLVTLLSTRGIGPFLCVAIEDRHTAAQAFALAMIAVPLLLGSLVAERESSRLRWLRSELLRQSLLKVLPDVAYRLANDGTILDVTAPEGEPLPRPRESMLGQRVADLGGPALGPRFTQAIAQARAGQRPEPLEYRIDTPDGSRMREARFVPLGDDEVLAVVRDITERQRARRLLTWQAEILERIAKGRPDAEMFAALVQGIETFLAPAKASLLLVQGPCLRLACAPNLPAEYNTLVDGLRIGPDVGCCGAAAHSGTAVIAEDLDRHPNWVPFRDAARRFDLRACWSAPVRAPDGAVVGTFAVYLDTPRAPDPGEFEFVERAAVLAGITIDRSRREHLLAAITHNVSDGLYRSVPDHGLVYANAAFARAFGYPNEAELLQAVAGQLPAGPHGDDLRRFATDAKEPATGELLLHRRDGTPFWAMLSRTVVAGPDGRVAACDGALTDVTERRQLAEQLRQAQKMEAIGKLAGGVAHDFNNLLTAITGYAEVIRDHPDAAAVAADAAEILRASDRAASLTRQLLAFSRQQVLAPQVVDLGTIVDGTLGMLRRLIGEHIRCSVVTHGGPWTVRVDKGQIEQVLMNLALNARDAMPTGGTLEIRLGTEPGSARAGNQRETRPAGPLVTLAVRDTGSGMDAATRARAFEPFFTTKAPGKGTGLGLATVYGIVQQSGGTVWLDSTTGQGTTVHIALPRVSATVKAEPTVMLPRATTTGSRILLAEDEPLVRDLVVRILQRAGHQVVACSDGAEALAALPDGTACDVLVTDTVMPNVGGRDLAAALWRRRPDLPVLFLSGYASDGVPSEGAGGPRAFLAKPFLAPQLLAAISALLNRPPVPSPTAGTNP